MMISAATYLPTAVEQYEALAQKAQRYGMTDLQARALMGQAYPASWHSLSRSERIVSSAIDLNRHQTDPVVRSIIQANCHFWRLWLGGWNDESAAICRECGVTIEASADRRSVAWYRLEQALMIEPVHRSESAPAVDALPSHVPVLHQVSQPAPNGGEVDLPGAILWTAFALGPPGAARQPKLWHAGERSNGRVDSVHIDGRILLRFGAYNDASSAIPDIRPNNRPAQKGQANASGYCNDKVQGQQGKHISSKEVIDSRNHGVHLLSIGLA